MEARGDGSRLGRGEVVDKELGLNAPAPADFQPYNDKTAAALGCKLRVDRDAFAPRSLGDGGCGGGGSMGVCRAIPANGAKKGCVNSKLCAVPGGGLVLGFRWRVHPRGAGQGLCGLGGRACAREPRPRCGPRFFQLARLRCARPR